eukprot:4858488-Pleurochrysis_carterae.AAC.2
MRHGRQQGYRRSRSSLRKQARRCRLDRGRGRSEQNAVTHNKASQSQLKCCSQPFGEVSCLLLEVANAHVTILVCTVPTGSRLHASQSRTRAALLECSISMKSGGRMSTTRSCKALANAVRRVARDVPQISR